MGLSFSWLCMVVGERVDGWLDEATVCTVQYLQDWSRLAAAFLPSFLAAVTLPPLPITSVFAVLCAVGYCSNLDRRLSRDEEMEVESVLYKSLMLRKGYQDIRTSKGRRRSMLGA